MFSQKKYESREWTVADNNSLEIWSHFLKGGRERPLGTFLTGCHYLKERRPTARKFVATGDRKSSVSRESVYLVQVNAEGLFAPFQVMYFAIA